MNNMESGDCPQVLLISKSIEYGEWGLSPGAGANGFERGDCPHISVESRSDLIPLFRWGQSPQS